jgi:hypothetical protein
MLGKKARMRRSLRAFGKLVVLIPDSNLQLGAR